MDSFIFLDIESTGMRPGEDQIIEIACIRWENGVVKNRFESLVKPSVPVPYEIQVLTGITDEDVANAPVFSEIKDRVAAFIGDRPIVGHNIAFDMGFLKKHGVALENKEIDTLALAHILLPKEASYSLEVLMKKYQLTTRNSHRAMVDTETTVEFFEFLLGRIQELAPTVWSDIETILAKSTWLGKKVFKLLEKNSPLRPTFSSAHWKPTIQLVSLPVEKKYWSNDVVKKFLEGKKILLESAALPPLHVLKDVKPVIAYAASRTREMLIQEALSREISICIMHNPELYISPKKFKKTLEQEKFSDEETIFLLKITLWLEATETGTREELSLEREDYAYFSLLADHEKNDVFWEKALSSAHASDIALVHQYTLAHDIKSYSERPLIILDASHLESSLTHAHTKRITEAEFRPVFKEKATMALGLLGIFYEKYVDPELMGFRGNVIVGEASRRSFEWQRFYSALENLPDCHAKTEALGAVAPDSKKIQWVSSFAEQLILSSAPKDIAEIFKQAALPYEAKGIIMQSSALSGNSDFSFVRSLFHLGTEWETYKEVPTKNVSKLIIPEKFPEPYSSKYFEKCYELFSEIIEQQKGNTLFLLSSKKMVAAMHQALLPKFQKSKTRVLAVGPSGGTGKSVALFSENPTQCVLIATSQILPYFQKIEDHLHTIIFQKIPFDMPDDPLCSARAASFKNGFTQYTLPRAVIKFHELIAEFEQSGEKTCYILDSRILTRDYGKMFLN